MGCTGQYQHIFQMLLQVISLLPDPQVVPGGMSGGSCSTRLPLTLPRLENKVFPHGKLRQFHRKRG